MYVGCIDAAAHRSIRKLWAHLKLMLRFSALDLCVRNYGLCHDYRDLVVVTAFVYSSTALSHSLSLTTATTMRTTRTTTPPTAPCGVVVVSLE